MKIIYIDDNCSNLSLMESVVKSLSPDTDFFGTDSPEDFLARAGDPATLYIIDFTLDGMLGDQLYEELLKKDHKAKAIITSAGYISDLQDLFLRFDQKPLAVTDRLDAIDILRKEFGRET